jgi:hypothetical protein
LLILAGQANLTINPFDTNIEIKVTISIQLSIGMHFDFLIGESVTGGPAYSL